MGRGVGTVRHGRQRRTLLRIRGTTLPRQTALGILRYPSGRGDAGAADDLSDAVWVGGWNKLLFYYFSIKVYR